MTDYEINGVVAARNKWTLTPEGKWRHPNGRWIFDDPPKYTGSLDLMHKAEAELTPAQRCDMAIYIIQQLDASSPIHFASARQHAVAYLKALNLWKTHAHN